MKYSIRFYLVSILLLMNCLTSLAQTTVPDCWTIFADNFDKGLHHDWRRVPSDDPNAQPWHAPGQGFQGTGAMAVTVNSDESYLYRAHIADAEEAYVSFLFHPSSVNIPDEGTTWIPGKSIRIADIKGGDVWHPMVSLRIRKKTGSGYTGYLGWYSPDGSEFDYESGEFPMVNDWQLITIGFRTNTFVAAWINGNLVRSIDSVTHSQARGGIFEFGKCSSNSHMTPSGIMLFDAAMILVPKMNDIYVDPAHGNDSNTGATRAEPFQTIARALELAGPGTNIRLLPGVYRESIDPLLSGTPGEPIRIFPEEGKGTAVVRGSVPSNLLSWTQLQTDPIGLPPGVDPPHIYWTELPDLEETPRWIAMLNGEGEQLQRLPLAREPDWHVETDWKRHEFWWCADGGSAPAECDPTTDSDCDLPWRSFDQLTDLTHDSEPMGVEPGNLSTLGDLIGGTLRSIDTLQGHYIYRREITDHEPGVGRITVDKICEHDGGSGKPGLGMFSKYYVENRPCLLDSPGEWWFDLDSKRLYLWPPLSQTPADLSIEISVLVDGANLRDVSYIHLENLIFEYFNESCVEHENWSHTKAYGNAILNCDLRYANNGLWVVQSIEADQPGDFQTRNLLIRGNKIHHQDSMAIRHVDWWENGAAADSWVRPGIIGTVIEDNELYELGFRCDGDNAIGASFGWSDHLTFQRNHVHHVAHNGVQFSRSVIHSEKEYGFAPDEIKTGDILVMDNIFEHACQLTCDNGGIKFWGKPPDGHVFRDVLITGNIARNNFGWTYCAEKRGRWTSGTAQGTGGFGFYVDHASGMTFFRNIAYNNGYTGFLHHGVWRDGTVTVINNISANNPYGYIFGGSSYDTHDSIGTVVLNNLAINNAGYGMLLSDGDDTYNNMYFDHNLYYANGWHEDVYRGGSMTIYVSGGNHYYQEIQDIRTGRGWEIHGKQQDPQLMDYDWLDQDRHDGSWPDFHVTPGMSPAVNAGTGTTLPLLDQVMATFGLDPQLEGPAFDMGRFETYPYVELPTGITLWMPSEMYEAGDACMCYAGVSNDSIRILDGYPVVILLDVYGSFYFAPSFNSVFDSYLETLPVIPYGVTLLEILPPFTWPTGIDSGGDVTWYGAILDPSYQHLVGELGMWQFGWR